MQLLPKNLYEHVPLCFNMTYSCMRSTCGDCICNQFLQVLYCVSYKNYSNIMENISPADAIRFRRPSLVALVLVAIENDKTWDRKLVLWCKCVEMLHIVSKTKFICQTWSWGVFYNATHYHLNTLNLQPYCYQGNTFTNIFWPRLNHG